MSYPPMTQPLIPNRPLGVGDILQTMFSLYRRGWKTLILLTLLPSVLSVIIVVAALIGMLLPLVPLLLSLQTDYMLETAILSTLGSMALLIIIVLVGGLLLTAVNCWAAAGVAVAVQTMDEGRMPTMREIWQRCRLIIGQCFALMGLLAAAVLGVNLLFFLIGGLALALEKPGLLLMLVPASFALIIASVIVNAKLALTLPVLGIEQVTAVAAIKRSWRLTEGAVLRVIGVQLLVSLLISLGQQILGYGSQAALGGLSKSLEYVSADPASVLIGAGPVALIVLLAGTAYRILTAPAMWLVDSVLYIDLNRRKLHGMA